MEIRRYDSLEEVVHDFGQGNEVTVVDFSKSPDRQRNINGIDWCEVHLGEAYTYPGVMSARYVTVVTGNRKWFYHLSKFYFINADDALIFKLTIT